MMIMRILGALVIAAAIPSAAFCQHIAELPGGTYSRFLAFSPTGKLIAVGNGLVINVMKGTDFVLTGKGKGTRMAAFIDDGTLVTVSYNSFEDRKGKVLLRLSLFDIRSGKEEKSMDAEGAPLALSQGGRFFLSHPFDAAGTLLVHDIMKAKCVKLKCDDQAITQAAITDDGRFVAARCNNGDVGVWQLPEGKLLWRTASKFPKGKVLFVKNGERLLGANWSGVTCWNAKTGVVVRQLNTIGAASADGKWIVTSDRASPRTKELAFTSIASGEVVKRINWKDAAGKDGRWWQGMPVAISPDSRLLAVFGWVVDGANEKGKDFEGTIRIFEMPKESGDR